MNRTGATAAISLDAFLVTARRPLLVGLAALFGGYSVTAQAQSAAEAETFTIGAVGDSISAGFNADRLLNNRDLSWTTGDSSTRRVNSHYFRLRELHPDLTIRGINEAIAGSVAADLVGQTQRLMRNQVDYVTIMIGANDVCTWEEADYVEKMRVFQNHVVFAVQSILTANANTRIVLVQIPDVYRIWELGSTRSCQTKWNLFGMCKPLLGESRSAADREAFRARWRAANNTLANIAAMFPDRVLFDDSLGATPFEWEHVSRLDCFHPSIAGQNLISELTWQNGLFYE